MPIRISRRRTILKLHLTHPTLSGTNTFITPQDRLAVNSVPKDDQDHNTKKLREWLAEVFPKDSLGQLFKNKYMTPLTGTLPIYWGTELRPLQTILPRILCDLLIPS